MHRLSRPGDSRHPSTLGGLVFRLFPFASGHFSRSKRANCRSVVLVLLCFLGAIYCTVVFGLNISATRSYASLVFRNLGAELHYEQGAVSEFGGENASRDTTTAASDGLDRVLVRLGRIVRSGQHPLGVMDATGNDLKDTGREDGAALPSRTPSRSIRSAAKQLYPVTGITTHLSKIKPGHVAGKVAQDVMSYGLYRDGLCIDGWQSKGCYETIVRYAAQRQQNGTVIMVVTARGSFDIILNWCVGMQRIGLDNYMLVALDNEAVEFFKQKGAPVVALLKRPGKGKVSRTDLWIQRAFLAQMILSEGINVLISDADAVMVKSPFGNPLSHFDDHSVDIITSPSNFPNPTKGELPEACHSLGPGKMEWRHSPCMGWTFLRSSKRMYLFFSQVFLPDVIRYKDDQIGFSCAIRKAGAEWNDGPSWTTNTAVKIRATALKLTLLMLPSALFVRNCTQFQDEKERGYGISKFDPNLVQVYHCKGSNKKMNAQNNDFWFVKDNWESVTKDPLSSFSSYLGLISNAP